jgi:hypothetical protein
MSRTNRAVGSTTPKSEFISLIYKIGNDKFYNFLDRDVKLRNVPVALAGSVTPDHILFWQIAGEGMNGKMQKYLGCISHSLLTKANIFLMEQSLSEKAAGKITKVDLARLYGSELDSQVQTILYSASPDLRGEKHVKAKSLMIDFGKEFRTQLGDKGIPELCLPLYSGGVYRGQNTQKEVAEWLMEGWFAAEEEYPAMPRVKVYLGHQCLVDAATARGILCTEHSSSATTTAVFVAKSSPPPKRDSDPRTPSRGSVKKEVSGLVAKDLKSRNSRDFAYSDREIDTVNSARNTQDGIFYCALDGYTTNILLNRDGHLLKEGGKIVVELPACDAMGEFSPINDRLREQFVHLNKLERLGTTIYPLKILFPYKVEGWHWNAGEIIVTENAKSRKFIIEGRAYDPYGKGGSLNDVIKFGIRGFFTEQFGSGSANFKLDIVSNIEQVQKGGVACGLYAARAMHNLKTKGSPGIWDGVLVHGAIKEDQDLRDEDSALVEKHCIPATSDKFCFPIDERAYKKETSKGAYKEEEVEAAAMFKRINEIMGGKFNVELSGILMQISCSDKSGVAYDIAFEQLAAVHENLPEIFFEKEGGNKGDALFTAESIGIVFDLYSGAEDSLKAREGVAKDSSSRGPVIKSSEAAGKSNAVPEFNPKYAVLSSGALAKETVGRRSPNPKSKTSKVSTSIPAGDSESIIFSEEDPEFNREYADEWSSGSLDEEGLEANKSPLKPESITPEVAKSIRRDEPESASSEVDSEDESASAEDSESVLSEGGSEDESASYSKPILSDRVEIEGMKSIGGNKIELNLRDKETGNVPVVINLSENRLLEVSSDENEVQIKVEDFRKELMDYYNRKESYAVGEDGKAVELKKEALEVLRIYQAVPSTSVALKSVSRIVVGNLSKPR